MAKRKSMSKRKSKRLFSKTGARVHRKNLRPAVRRGGYRL
jgi:hypothetical protein